MRKAREPKKPKPTPRGADSEGPERAPDPTTLRVANRMRSIRRQQRLSLDELSERTGIPPESLGRYERGRNSPTLRMLHRIAAGLHVDPAVLFTGGPGAGELGDGEVPEPVRDVVTALNGRPPDDIIRARLLLFALFAEPSKLQDPGSLPVAGGDEEDR